MSQRVRIPVAMELLSDTIFGSGFSIPGGADIAVAVDQDGLPYLKGASLKGLLRESAENCLVWENGPQEALDEIFGREGWNGITQARRLQVTELRLEKRPADVSDCFVSRTFTSIDSETGTAAKGTLRAASCIRQGLRFSGSLYCEQADAALLRKAALGVKWAGTMRSRGFGRIRLETGAAVPETRAAQLPACGCIHYRLHAELPVMITDLRRSSGNSYETQGYLPGSAIRGLVMSRLAEEDSAWFAEHKAALLGEATRFWDALPNPAHLAAIPSLRGFYENKEETIFETVVRDGTFTPGSKRARLGAFCALEGDTVRYWSAETDGVTRIQRSTASGEDTRPFQTRYLCAGQDFDGCILLDDPSFAPHIARALGSEVWLGADRCEGFGRCTVTALEPAEAPACLQKYAGDFRENVLYLVLLSPLSMLDAWGEPCGLDEAVLAQKLGVDTAHITYCSTAVAEYDSYNRSWQCRAPAARMYDRGSVFRIECSQPPQRQAVQALEQRGLGIRTAEGYGQILLLPRGIFEQLSKKEHLEAAAENGAAKQAAALRRRRLAWLMQTAAEMREYPLSASQLGELQALCQKAIAGGGSTAELDTFMEKNLDKGDPRHSQKFRQIDALRKKILGTPLPTLLGTPCSDSPVLRMQLLCDLIDHSRKLKKTGGLGK